MNSLNIDGNWTQKKAKLLQTFTQLTEEDLRYSQGQEAALVGRVQRRLEVPEDIAQKIIRYS